MPTVGSLTRSHFNSLIILPALVHRKKQAGTGHGCFTGEVVTGGIPGSATPAVGKKRKNSEKEDLQSTKRDLVPESSGIGQRIKETRFSHSRETRTSGIVGVAMERERSFSGDPDFRGRRFALDSLTL
ncbi:hypothetical protein K1719_024360 [Acacia pycnantha]|nr:hypothetical protein K1719_024360 [Acacia pycnantha]